MKSTPNPPECTQSQRREKAASDALRALIRDTLLDKFPSLADSPLEIPLQLSLRVTCSDPGTLEFEPGLREQLLTQTEVFLQPRETFQFGTVYDFQSHTNCRPPDALAVFAGYDALGHPQWSAVSGILSPELPLRIMSGKELKKEQLQACGKNDKAFDILGQVVRGPLPTPKAYQKLTGNPEWALTCQIVECRDSRGHFALRVNLLAAGLLPEELNSLLQETAFHNLGRALSELEEAVYQLEQRSLQAWKHQNHPERAKLLERVPKLLGSFAARLS